MTAAPSSSNGDLRGLHSRSPSASSAASSGAGDPFGSRPPSSAASMPENPLSASFNALRLGQPPAFLSQPPPLERPSTAELLLGGVRPPPSPRTFKRLGVPRGGGGEG
eukprot:670438-Prorocentrum_minimum.AAC.1